MHRFFGKPKPKVEGPSLEDTSKGISGRITDLEAKIKAQDDELRKCKEQLAKTKGPAAANIKRRAMDILKRKKMYEGQRDQLMNQQFNIDQTSFAIASVKDTQTTVAAMKTAAKTLKAENKKINLSELEDMQDEMEDLLEDVGEISEILSRSYGTPYDIDEADLDAELACLEDELEFEEDLGVSTATPATASTVPAASFGLSDESIPSAPNLNLNKPNEIGLNQGVEVSSTYH